jgi:hypothetical protein
MAFGFSTIFAFAVTSTLDSDPFGNPSEFAAGPARPETPLPRPGPPFAHTDGQLHRGWVEKAQGQGMIESDISEIE